MPNNFKLKTFDVTLLFTNVPLDSTIDVILKQIYKQNEVNTNIHKQQIGNNFLLCITNVYFSYNSDINIHKNWCEHGFAAGSSTCRHIYG